MREARSTPKPPISAMPNSSTCAHMARWPHAIPQHAPGHPQRVTRIEAALDSVDGFYLAGNALHGVGLSRAVAVGAVAENRQRRRCWAGIATPGTARSSAMPPLRTGETAGRGRPSVRVPRLGAAG